MKMRRRLFSIGLLCITWATGSYSQNSLPAEPVPDNSVEAAVNWFPVRIRFGPSGDWAVVNFCSYRSPTLCRLVRWDLKGASQEIGPNLKSTGHWTLIAGQMPGKSYMWPAVAWHSNRVAFVASDCRREVNTGTERTVCETSEGELVVSDSLSDIRAGNVLPVSGVNRLAWRPDDQALIYWRAEPPVQLASGRRLASPDVYEFDTADGIERFMSGAISWRAEYRGPFYAPDGRTFALCGFGMRVPVALQLQALVQCVQVDRERPMQVSALNPERLAQVFNYVVADAKDGRWLVLGDRLRLVRKDSFDQPVDLINLRTPEGHSKNIAPVDTDVSVRGDVAVVNDTWFAYNRPIPRNRYWRSDLAAPPFPVLTIFVKEEGAILPVIWPDVDRMK